jgi:aminopeptidase N
MVAAEAATPDPMLKQEVWDRIHKSGYSSLRLALAASASFWRRGQHDIVEPFVPQFFDGLADLYGSWEQEAAKGYFTTFFPAYRVDESTLAMIDAVLADPNLGPMLHRQLVEAKDDMQRAIKCRALAGAGV